jgi:single-strand DNA-binding protein
MCFQEGKKKMSSDITLIGNLTATPELRYGKNGGKPWATFSVAVNKGREEEGNKTSHFFDVKCFNEFAEHMAELPKGTRVLIIGHQEQESWDDKTTGKKRSKHVVVAREGGPSVRYTAVTASPSKAPSKVEQQAVDAVQQGFAEPSIPAEEPF